VSPTPDCHGCIVKRLFGAVDTYVFFPLPPLPPLSLPLFLLELLRPKKPVLELPDLLEPPLGIRAVVNEYSFDEMSRGLWITESKVPEMLPFKRPRYSTVA
jgi:hypothetical protein